MGNVPTKEEDRQSPQQTAEPDEVMARRHEEAGGDGGGAATSSFQRASNNPAVAGRKRRRGGPSSTTNVKRSYKNAAQLEFASSSDDDSSSSCGRRPSKRSNPTTDNGNANRRKKAPVAAGGKVVIDVEENRQIPKCADHDCDFVDSRKPAAKDPSDLPLAVAPSSGKHTQEDTGNEDETNVKPITEGSKKRRSDQPMSCLEDKVTGHIALPLQLRVDELTKENAQLRETNRELESSQLDSKTRAGDDAQRVEKIEELEGQVASQKKEHEACKRARDALLSSVDSLTQTNGEQTDKIKVLEQQLVGQEKDCQERLEAQQKSLDGQRSVIVKLEERLESLQRTNVELISGAKQQKDQLVETQKQHEVDRAAATAELAKIRQDRAEELAAERSKCDDQKKEVIRLEQRLAKETIDSENLQLENKTLKDRVSSNQQQQQATASSHSDQIAKLQAELKRERSAQSSYAELKRRNAKLEDDNEKLMEDLQLKEDVIEAREEEHRVRENVLKASVGVLEAEKIETAHRLEAERSKAARHAEEASGLRERLKQAEEERDAAERARAREVDSLTQEYAQRIDAIQSANLREQEALRDEKRSLEALLG